MVLLKGIMKEAAMIFIVIWLLVMYLFIPKTVDDRVELAQIKLGYPVYFVAQDSSGLSIGMSDSSPFPQPIGFISPWYNPARFL